MQLPEFLYCEPQANIRGAGFIIQTKPPFIWARVHKFETPKKPDFLAHKAKFADYAFYKVPGYLIALSFSEVAVKTTNIPTETIYNTLAAMAAYYKTEKIDTNGKSFKFTDN